MRVVQEYLIALGGNLPSAAGPPDQTLRRALRDLEAAGCRDLRVSRFFRTPCFPPGAGPDYVNAAAVLNSELDPRGLLDLLHRIEADYGRERVERWGRRTLDLDLVAAGDAVLPDADTQARWRALPPEDQTRQAPGEIILPHPRLQDRAFVLVPLADIAPDWVHPLLGLRVTEMIARLPAGAVDEVDQLAVAGHVQQGGVHGVLPLAFLDLVV